MKALRQALNEYLALRRSLGYKLHAECVRLPKFLSFLESKNAGYVSAATALEWAIANDRGGSPTATENGAGIRKILGSL